MPASLTYPGVYVEEVPSAVRTITGVPTSTAAFVGDAPRGPVDRPTHVTSWADYQRIYGGLAKASLLGYAVYHFFQNGGAEAEIVRLERRDSDLAKIDLGNDVNLTASSAGTWGNSLRARVDYGPHDDGSTWTLTVFDKSTGARETFAGIESGAGAARTLDVALRASHLVRSSGENSQRPDASPAVPAGQDPFADPAAGADPSYAEATGGLEGDHLGATAYLGSEDDKTGIHQLLKTDIFNLLCIVPEGGQGHTTLPDGVLSAALELCVKRRAMLLVDAPEDWADVASARDGMANPATAPVSGESARNAAVFFPQVILPDPLDGGVAKAFPPSGGMAGVIARTDAQRGVWKASAGTDASLNGARGTSVPMTDLENGELNPLGINCIRQFPIFGTVNWGARTMRGADALADQWKYLPVRRTALFIEESLYRGTKWVVFEPNDEPLWASIRLNVGAFMNSLFRQGAFQGRTPREAYFVKCDKESNPQNDIDRGILNILVGFAPLKPAEFVVIHIQQLSPELTV
jgi:uncharacterized protein